MKTGRAGAATALMYSVSMPLAVALGIGLSIAGPTWWFAVGGVAGLLILRIASPRVEEYEEGTGAKVSEFAIFTPGYLRFYAARLGWDWRVAAAACWLPASALVCFWMFLWLHAIYDFTPQTSLDPLQAQRAHRQDRAVSGMVVRSQSRVSDILPAMELAMAVMVVVPWLFGVLVLGGLIALAIIGLRRYRRSPGGGGVSRGH